MWIWFIATVLGMPSLGVSQTLLIVGDSLSSAYGLANVDRGWVALLQQRVSARGYQVVNASIPGDTTAGGVARIKPVLDREKPAWVLLELGANDGLRGLAPVQTRANLLTIITQSKQAGARVLVLGMRMPPNYGRAYTEAFQAVFPAVAAETSSPLVPFLLEGVGGKPEYLQADAVHPNEAAQPLLFENVWRVFEPLLELGGGR